MARIRCNLVLSALLAALWGLFSATAFAQDAGAPSDEDGARSESTIAGAAEYSEQEVRDRAYELEVDELAGSAMRRGRRRIIAGSVITGVGMGSALGFFSVGVRSHGSLGTVLTWPVYGSAALLTATAGTPLLINGLRLRADARLMRSGRESYEESGDLRDIYPTPEEYDEVSRRFRSAGIAFASGAAATALFSIIMYAVNDNEDLSINSSDFSANAIFGSQFILLPTFTSAAIQLLVTAGKLRRAGDERAAIHSDAVPRVSVSPTRGGMYSQLSWTW